MTVNIVDLKFRQTGVLDVLHPATREPLGWRVTFAGPGHPKTVAANNTEAKRSLSRQITGAQIPRTIEVTRRENVQSIVVRILDWTPVQLAEGAEPTGFDEASATALLLDPNCSWILRQFLDFLDAPASFLGPSVGGAGVDGVPVAAADTPAVG